MSNLLDKASIVLTPTAYSEGVVHTVKPEIELGEELLTNLTEVQKLYKINSKGLTLILGSTWTLDATGKVVMVLRFTLIATWW